MSRLLIDRSEIARHLELLGKNGETRYRAFLHKRDPRKGTSEGKGLERKGYLQDADVENLQNTLGVGVYLVVNNGGDNKEEITHAVASFAEWDGLSYEEQLKALNAAVGDGLPRPTFCVRTHPGDDASLHLKWVYLEPSENILLWRLNQWRLIQLLKADHHIEDPPRVMRLAGCHYMRTKGDSAGLTQIVDDLGSGKRVSVAEMHAGLAAAEQKRGLRIAEAVPESWLRKGEELTNLLEHVRSAVGDDVVQEVRDRIPTKQSFFPPEQSKALSEQREKVKAHLFAIVHCNNEVEIKQALACIPTRVPGKEEYYFHRNILWSLKHVCAEVRPPVDDPTEFAIELMRAHSPDGWDVAQVARSGGEAFTASTFWWHATEHGFRPSSDVWKRDIEPAEYKNALWSYAQIQLTELVDSEASEVDLQVCINSYPDLNGHNLNNFCEKLKAQRDRQRDNADALDALFLRGQRPKLVLEDYLPSELVEFCYVLRHGLRYPDETIIFTIVAAIAALLPPGIRVHALSMREPVAIWYVLVGASGVRKSPMLRRLVEDPIVNHVLPILDQDNDILRRQWQNAITDKEADPGPKPRPRRLLFTSPTSQGIRADLAANGATTPVLLLKDELAGWFKDMASPIAGCSDTEFFLSSYDESFSSDVFADDKKSREVRYGKVSVIGGIQPKVLDEHMPDGMTNGFYSRFLFAQIPVVRNELLDDPHPGALSDALGKLYATLVRRLTAPGDLIGSDASIWHSGLELSASTEFHLTPSALVAFLRFYEQLEDYRMDASSESIQALWAKASGQLLRLSAALQVIRLHFRMERLEDMEDLPAQSSLQYVHRIPISEETLGLAMGLLLAGKTSAEDSHRKIEDPRFALMARFKEVTLRLQGQKRRPVTLREVQKAGWTGRRDAKNRRPSATELRELAVAFHAQGVMEFNPESSTVVCLCA